MKHLILLSGKKRSGKDTSCLMIKHIYLGIKQVALATPLKEIMADTFDIPSPELEAWKNDEYGVIHGVPRSDQANTRFRMQSYREVLQRFGTNAMKRWFGVDVWSKLATEQVYQYFKITDTVVITDWRFKSEYEYLASEMAKARVKVTTIRVERDGVDLGDGHFSEIDLDDFEFDHIITNNGTLDELKEKLKVIL